LFEPSRFRCQLFNLLRSGISALVHAFLSPHRRAGGELLHEAWENREDL